MPLLRNNGVQTQIFQNSFLTDNSARNLREFYFLNTVILKIDSFPERDNPNTRVFESAKMSVCILQSVKRKIKDYEFIVSFWNDKYKTSGHTNFFKVSELFIFDEKQLNIPNLKTEEQIIYRNYFSSKNKYSDFFDCLEGELNMTFHKDYMTSNSELPLIAKGAQIQRYYVTNKPSQGKIEYVEEASYLKKYKNSPKSRHSNLQRIALQGISGANDKIRIIGTMIKKGVYCANSCNYIISLQSNKLISIKSLLGILNSYLTNWIFRKSSTNSNVNCYEINNLRLPKSINQNLINLIETLVEYILWLKKNENLLITPYEKAASNYFESVIDGMVYELYFEESVKKYGKDILKYLSNLPEIKETDKPEKIKETVMKTFFELYDEKSPVRNALYYMDSVPEVKIIEGKK